MDKDELLIFLQKMNTWFVENEFKGHDPYQLDQKASTLMQRFPFLKYVRKALKPLHVFIPKSTFSYLPKIYHPKAIGLIIGGNGYMYSITKDQKYIEQNKELLELLLFLRNKDFKHAAWGSPFEWGSNPRYPKNTPAICLVSPIGIALLNAYKHTGQESILHVCNDIAKHIIHENGFQIVNSMKSFLYYSPYDKNEVYNSNALAASFLCKLGFETNANEEIVFSRKLQAFVIDSQNKDGSWFYSKESKIIDNRHTGFIIESMADILRYEKDNNLASCLENGVDYYDKNLMAGGLSKWTPEQQYPIDIHDVAQSILTYIALNRQAEARYIAEFAINKMSNGEDEFYFKFFKNGKTNKNVFYRWGQAWMYYAIAKLLYHEKNN